MKKQSPTRKPNMTFTPLDPKYQIMAASAAAIVKTSDIHQAIPADEPKILFRARDRNALEMLQYYRLLCEADRCTAFHLRGIQNRIEAFEKFREKHPDRMKQPGITRGK